MQIAFRTALTLIALHAIEIMIWAGSYIVLLPDGELASFEEAVYFSFVTFTTLGYGDITLSEGYQRGSRPPFDKHYRVISGHATNESNRRRAGRHHHCHSRDWIYDVGTPHHKAPR